MDALQRWTPQHAKFVGRVILSNFLSLPLKNYQSVIEEVEREIANAEEGNSEFRLPSSEFVRRLSRANSNAERRTRSAEEGNTVVAKIERTGKKFTIRYACDGFNKIYVIDNTVRNELCADSNIRSMLFRLRRISSRNALTHSVLRGIIEHQGEFLRTGDATDLVPLSQVKLTEWMNRVRTQATPKATPEDGQASPRRDAERGARNGGKLRAPSSAFRVCNSWVSRLVNGISVIVPSGEEKPLRCFFQTQKDVNKRLIKQILDKENLSLTRSSEGGTRNLQCRRRSRNADSRIKMRSYIRVPGAPLTDNQIKHVLENEYGVTISRHSVGHCRKEMGIPPAKRRLSGYKYPPLSANFSVLYPLTLESVQNNAPLSSGVYEFRLQGKEIEYPNGKTNVIYLGSAMKLKKRLKEHLRANNKNGQIRDFLKKFGCSFRYIQFSRNWKEEEARLYSLFVTTYGASPKCNRVRP